MDLDDLLDGLEGEEREARRSLLEQLSADGVSDEELRKAAEEQRLALLPVERVLLAEQSLTAEDVAERAGVDVEFVKRHRRALGLPLRGDGAEEFSENDVRRSRT